MILKLTITKKSDPSFFQELDYSSFPIFLGREEDADVPLADPFRIISRKHAQIVNTEGILQLIDLGSANSTYINDQKLIAKEETPLTTGDIIKIGEYELQVQLLSNNKDFSISSADDDNKTVVFTSPYNEEISIIAENINKIAQKYSSDDSPMKSEALKFTLGQAFSDNTIYDIKKIFAEALSDNPLSENLFASDKKKTSYSNSIDFPERFEHEHVSSSKKKMPSDISGSSSADYPFSNSFSNILDTLLDMFSKLTQGLLHFRQEFFGATIYYQFPADSLKDLKEYLFNPAISPDEESKRVNLLKEETHKLLIHHAGLLEGYKLSVTEGSKLLLKSLDPENNGAENTGSKMSERSSHGGFLSNLNKSKKLKSFTETFKKYIADPYYIEKKFFRPSFIKGYQKRIPDKSLSQF